MTDYMRCGDLQGHNLADSHFMGFDSLSANGDYGSYEGPLSPNFLEMPGSPSSVASDCSYSTSSTECMSVPASPMSSDEASAPLEKKPRKSNLRRPGAQRPRRVTWDPTTVFETNPLRPKRARVQCDDEQIETAKCPERTQEEGLMQGRFDAELCAPIPTKRAKLAEITAHAAVGHLVLPSISLVSEPSRPILPSFNFEACVLRTPAKMEVDKLPVVSAPPATLCFSFAAPKRRPLPRSSLLPAKSF